MEVTLQLSNGKRKVFKNVSMVWSSGITLEEQRKGTNLYIDKSMIFDETLRLRLEPIRVDYGK